MIKKEALFKIGYGLYVLTAREDNSDNGCIINTVMQVTETPLRICVCVNKSNHTHDMILKSGKFNVSCLTESADFDVFKQFGFQSGKSFNKFEGYSGALRSENGVLYITENTNAYISCEVCKTEDLGTHTMFIADVVASECLSHETSVTYDYYFKHIKPSSNAKKGYVCKICGYVYEGAELPDDFICPLCKHGAADFEEIR